MTRTYVTVSIPYVNARPHVGYALELVQADAFARARRARGDDVRLLGGTDDHALKNVLAAEEAGVSTRTFVDRNAERFAALAAPLAISFDDFIRTSHDPRHRSGVERLWHRCAEQGDFYRRQYEGRYCVGCEQFYAAADLVGGLEGARCPEHGAPLESVAEENWFFRLSRYQDRIRELLETGELRIEPPQYRNEVLAFVRRGLDDLSVSRSRRRARDWGIPVPGDPTQVVYVWWDALGNYVTALDYGTGGDAYRTVVGGGRRARALRGQGHRAFPRGVLACVAAVGTANRFPPRSSSTRTSPPTGGSCRSPPATVWIPSSSAIASAWMRCGGGSWPTCPAPSMPTSPSNASSSVTTRISRTAWGTSSTAS